MPPWMKMIPVGRGTTRAAVIAIGVFMAWFGCDYFPVLWFCKALQPG
jgi:hypothetical protein